MFRSTPYNLKKIGDPSYYQVIAHTEITEEKTEDPTQDVLNQVGEALINIRLIYPTKGDMITQCFFVNTQFVNQLSRTRYTSFQACNYLCSLYVYTLGGNHYMIELQQGDKYIGIDASAPIYRKDKAIAEVFIAKSHDTLINMINDRHKDPEPEAKTLEWLVNKPEKNDKLTTLLGIGLFTTSPAPPRTISQVTVTASSEETPSRCPCVIL